MVQVASTFSDLLLIKISVLTETVAGASVDYVDIQPVNADL